MAGFRCITFGTHVGFGPGSTCPPLYPPPDIEEPYEVREVTSRLPLDAIQRGYRMLQFWEPEDLDPFVLYDSNGRILGEWEEEPSYWQVMDAINLQ